MPGILTSTSAKSGFSRSILSQATVPLEAVPTILMPNASHLTLFCSPLNTFFSSSAKNKVYIVHHPPRSGQAGKLGRINPVLAKFRPYLYRNPAALSNR